MIGKLKGQIDTIAGDHVLIDVNGVCYQVFVSGKTLAGMKKGDFATLIIETVIRQEIPSLFGFHHTIEQEWFRLLTTVQGVGARVALAILSALSPEEIVFALYTQDKTQLTRAEGVGSKLAMRIMSELKDKGSQSSLTNTQDKNQSTLPHVVSDAFGALESLGYRRHEISTVLHQVMQQIDENAQTADVIRMALSIFGKG